MYLLMTDVSALLRAGEVRAAFVRVDVVDEREHVFRILIVVLHGQFDGDIIAIGINRDDLFMQRLSFFR